MLILCRIQLDTCLNKIDLNEFLAHVITGLRDDSDEIKVINHMMLFRLSQIAPTAVAQHLNEATPLLEATMKGYTVNKDTVKQDIERAAELQRSTLRAVAALSKISGGGRESEVRRILDRVEEESAVGPGVERLGRECLKRRRVRSVVMNDNRNVVRLRWNHVVQYLSCFPFLLSQHRTCLVTRSVGTFVETAKTDMYIELMHEIIDALLLLHSRLFANRRRLTTSRFIMAQQSTMPKHHNAARLWYIQTTVEES